MSLPNQPFFISIHIWHLFFFYLTMEIIHNQHLWPKAHSTPMWDTAQSQSTTISSSICQWSAGSFQSLVRHHVYKLGMHTPALLLCLGRLRCEPRCWALCHSPQSALGAFSKPTLQTGGALPRCRSDCYWPRLHGRPLYCFRVKCTLPFRELPGNVLCVLLWLWLHASPLKDCGDQVFGCHVSQIILIIYRVFI